MLFGGTATIRLILDGASVEVVVLFNVLMLLGKDNSVVVLGTSGSKFLLVLGIDYMFLVQGKNLLVLGMDKFSWYKVQNIGSYFRWYCLGTRK